MNDNINDILIMIIFIEIIKLIIKVIIIMNRIENYAVMPPRLLQAFAYLSEYFF